MVVWQADHAEKKIKENNGRLTANEKKQWHMIIENKDKKTAVRPFWRKDSAGQRLKAVAPSYLSLREKILSRREGEKSD